MKKKTFSLVTTTINIPNLLREYAKDARQYERKIENFIVVGDKKTPPEVRSFCENLTRECGISCIYLSPEDQDMYLKRWPVFRDFLPWNCIQRRNVGLLYAYFEGAADIIVTIDDDNLLSQEDYFGRHALIGSAQPLTVVKSESGWWNVCEMLVEAQGIPFYHRGHPLSKRWQESESRKTITKKEGRVVVNAGLWLEEPDIDAVTRLCFPIHVVEVSKKFPEKVACDIGTYAPFNSQNTALAREVIPAYFLFPYIGRYDDIWASYVVRHIADALGDFVTYGSPVVIQKRNPHNYFKDFDAERFGMEQNDVFLVALKGCVIKAQDYKGAFAEITEQFPRVFPNGGFERVSQGFQIWSGVFS